MILIITISCRSQYPVNIAVTGIHPDTVFMVPIILYQLFVSSLIVFLRSTESRKGQPVTVIDFLRKIYKIVPSQEITAPEITVSFRAGTGQRQSPAVFHQTGRKVYS